MKRGYLVVTLAVLIGVSIYCIFRYSASVFERMNLRQRLAAEETQITRLENDNQALQQDLTQARERTSEVLKKNDVLKGTVRAGTKRIHDLNMAALDTQERLQRLSSEVTLLKEETVALRQQQESLKLQLASVTEDNSLMKEKLNSIPELKKAIRELRVQAAAVAAQMRQKMREARVIIGNCGFIVRDGKSTYQQRVKIEVIPAH